MHGSTAQHHRGFGFITYNAGKLFKILCQRDWEVCMGCGSPAEKGMTLVAIVTTLVGDSVFFLTS